MSKSMTCKQLGGACDIAFEADTFEELAKLSKTHAMEMFKARDEAHLAAMQKMQELMKVPGAMEKWMVEKRQEFERLA